MCGTKSMYSLFSEPMSTQTVRDSGIKHKPTAGFILQWRPSGAGTQRVRVSRDGNQTQGCVKKTEFCSPQPRFSRDVLMEFTRALELSNSCFLMNLVLCWDPGIAIGGYNFLSNSMVKNESRAKLWSFSLTWHSKMPIRMPALTVNVFLQTQIIAEPILITVGHLCKSQFSAWQPTINSNFRHCEILSAGITEQAH